MYLKVVCPGFYAGFPHKIRIFNGQDFERDYDEICQEPSEHVKVAYLSSQHFNFDVDENGKMVNFYESIIPV